jgi:hypothetical protein
MGLMSMKCTTLSSICRLHNSKRPHHLQQAPLPRSSGHEREFPSLPGRLPFHRQPSPHADHVLAPRRLAAEPETCQMSTSEEACSNITAQKNRQWAFWRLASIIMLGVAGLWVVHSAPALAKAAKTAATPPPSTAVTPGGAIKGEQFPASSVACAGC